MFISRSDFLGPAGTLHTGCVGLFGGGLGLFQLVKAVLFGFVAFFHFLFFKELGKVFLEVFVLRYIGLPIVHGLFHINAPGTEDEEILLCEADPATVIAFVTAFLFTVLLRNLLRCFEMIISEFKRDISFLAGYAPDGQDSKKSGLSPFI